MTETIDDSNVLPTYTGSPEDLASLKQTHDVLRRAIAKPDELVEFDAQLPFIVGYVPEDERVILSAQGENLRYNFRELLPKTSAVLDKDMRLITDLGFLDRNNPIDVDSVNVSEGRPHRGWMDGTYGWHIDTVGVRQDPIYAWVISNAFPTESYHGPARIMYESNAGYGFFTFDYGSVPNNSTGILAPEFAVVRLGPLVIHRSPLVGEDVNRTFIRELADVPLGRY